jgi:Neuraminidase (sialidase)
MQSHVSVKSAGSAAVLRAPLSRLVLAGIAVTVLVALSAQAAAPGTDVNVTHDPSYRWGESQIAVNPQNPNNIVFATVGVGFTKACQQGPDCQTVPVDFGVGMPFPQPKGMFTNPDFNRVVAFTSFDRGKTWQRYEIPTTPHDHPDLTGTGDPYVTAAPDGTFYFSFDDNNWGTPEKPLPNAGVAVSKSTDGGRTWSVPVLGGTPVDGPRVTADPVTGTVYVSSSGRLGPTSTGDKSTPKGTVQSRWVASSQDGVQWTKPQPMGGFGANMSAAHGQLASAFKTAGQRSIFDSPNNELCGSAPTPCTIFQTSQDGGATWSRHVMPVPNTHAGFVLVAADPSKKGKGHFAVGLSMNTDGEFHVYQTRDGGATWTGPAVVTEDASKPRFHGNMAFSRQGVLGLMWRTRQMAPGQKLPPQRLPGMGPSVPYNVWAAVSRDGGATFSEPLKASSVDSPAPQSGPFAGSGDDFSGLAVEGNEVYVGWADWRVAERDNFFRAFNLKDFKFKPKH